MRRIVNSIDQEFLNMLFLVDEDAILTLHHLQSKE